MIFEPTKYLSGPLIFSQPKKKKKKLKNYTEGVSCFSQILQVPALEEIKALEELEYRQGKKMPIPCAACFLRSMPEDSL